MIREITKEEAGRSDSGEHLDDCAGWEDCHCFSMRVSHRDLYDMQQEIKRLKHNLGCANRSVWNLTCAHNALCEMKKRESEL